MGSIVGALTGSSGKGMARTPERAGILNPITQDQAKQQFQNTQDVLKQQQDFTAALQGQNGIQNQSNVYNQLQQQALGQGPNPAQAMLANQTGNNAAQQAALMAGQRGSSANSGLIARQAAQQGGALQQQAAGQGAALQAQQSANALGQMGNMAGQQVAQQANGLQGINNIAQANMGNMAQQNQAAIGSTDSINRANAAVDSQTAKGQSDMMGNMLGGIGSAVSDFGGGFMDSLGGLFSTGEGGGLSLLGAGSAEILPAVGGLAETYGPYMVAAKGGQVPKGPSSHVGQHFHRMAQGGKVPALVSPGEKYLNPKQVEQVKQGANPMKVGETIPGKPKVSGAKNSYANDTVKKNLDEGGIVLPRSVTKSKRPDQTAESFVAAILSRNKHKGK